MQRVIPSAREVLTEETYSLLASILMRRTEAKAREAQPIGELAGEAVGNILDRTKRKESTP